MFKLVSDSTTDLPESYFEEHNVEVLYLSCMLNGKVYNKENPISPEDFYKAIAEGAMPTTSQINPEEAKEAFEKIIKNEKNILYIAFSSGLSGTYNAIRLAAEEIMEENSDVKIIVIDSLAASMGEGLLLDKAVRLRDEGKNMEEVAEYIESHKLNLCHVFTADDLMHLYRGGRVKKSAAIVGTIAAIKPMMHVDNEGKLIPLSKVRGRKKSLTELVNMMEERIGTYRTEKQFEPVFISHSACIEDARFVADLVTERFGYTDIRISDIGPVIGSHTGIGTVALFFWGDNR